MGLRSRQRRRAGIADTIDPETTQRATDSLEGIAFYARTSCFVCTN